MLQSYKPIRTHKDLQLPTARELGNNRYEKFNKNRTIISYKPTNPTNVCILAESLKKYFKDLNPYRNR